MKIKYHVSDLKLDLDLQCKFCSQSIVLHVFILVCTGSNSPQRHCDIVWEIERKVLLMSFLKMSYCNNTLFQNFKFFKNCVELPKCQLSCDETQQKKKKILQWMYCSYGL